MATTARRASLGLLFAGLGGLATLVAPADAPAQDARAQAWSSFASAFPLFPCQDGWMSCLVGTDPVTPDLATDSGGRRVASDLRVGWFDLRATSTFSPFTPFSTYTGVGAATVADVAPTPEPPPIDDAFAGLDMTPDMVAAQNKAKAAEKEAAASRTATDEARQAQQAAAAASRAAEQEAQRQRAEEEAANKAAAEAAKRAGSQAEASERARLQQEAQAAQQHAAELAKQRQQADADAAAKAKAEAEAKKRADAEEKKRQATEAARAQADADARAKAEAERAKQEQAKNTAAEQQRAAEEQARQKQEAEAQARAQEEASSAQQAALAAAAQAATLKKQREAAEKAKAEADARAQSAAGAEAQKAAQAEAARLAAESAKLAEQQRQAEAQRQAEEQRQAEAKKKADAEAKAAEARQAQEAQAEAARKAEAQRLADERAAKAAAAAAAAANPQPVAPAPSGDGSAMVAPGPVPASDPGGCDLQGLEATASLGKLTAEQTSCFEGQLAAAPKMTDKKKISILLQNNAWAKGDKAEWERLVKRHLEDIDQSDPDIAYKYALSLAKLGPSRASGAIRYAEVALENRTVWTGDNYTSKVYSLYKVRAASAQLMWQAAEEAHSAAPTDETRKKADDRRNTTKVYAREWYEYAKSVGKDTTTALQLCTSAAGTAAYCEN